MSRFEVGMSNNYQVVQSQRDLREAQNSELRALLTIGKLLSSSTASSRQAQAEVEAQPQPQPQPQAEAQPQAQPG